MAKKKNKPLIRPWCWYCEREFEDEKVLMQHQKAKHFKCGMCPRRLNTAGGLAVHIQQVHKLEAENLPRIENALPGRDGYEVEIFGMEGIPAPDVADYKRRKEIELGLSAGSISQPQPKRAKIENRPLSEAELRAQLEAHKALMGNTSGAAGLEGNGGGGGASISGTPTVYGAPAQAYAMSAPATGSAGPTLPMSGQFPPRMGPPPGFGPGAPPPFPPPFPPQFGAPPFSLPPGPPGAVRPPFPPPPGFMGPPPPGFMGPPPPGMPGMPPPGMGMPPPHPAFIPSGVPPYGGPPGPGPGGVPPHPQQMQSNTARGPLPLRLPNPALKQFNPEFKKATQLKWNDANFSPEERRANDPKYFFDKTNAANLANSNTNNNTSSSGSVANSGNENQSQDVGGEEHRGKKRARAEDFL
ncbi:hypothetical protein FA15DRAFT_682714 [Coprinopsis marcescibilis]|uniref:C2H2-type domain-containing protein n=1 Tax=Coprinopsis marcescibilis TaxID=230819 RepID=A0A5C3KIE6_COPMA|nr:hypothetical protein FA15DRAFT_682714 [Coprinopsis marcescibilis]